MVERTQTREAVSTFQIVLGLSVVILLFYFQNVCAEYAKSMMGAANVLGGGTLSGGLHALSGPDHLAALLPFILGHKWYRAAFFGCVWGLGHGLTASMLGVLGFHVKDSLLGYKLLPQLTNLADYAVGVTLIIIGIMGIHEARQMDACDSSSKIADESEERLVNGDIETIRPFQHEETESIQYDKTGRGYSYSRSFAIPLTIFANGCFLGMSWDGLPSLAPALALYSWKLLFVFLTAYCLGTVCTIGIASGFIGESTKWLSTVTSADLPRRLAVIR